MDEAETESKKKFYAHRVALARSNDPGAAMIAAERAFSEDKVAYAYGKKVAGLVKAKLQKKFGKNIDIYQPTDQIKEVQFLDIHSVA